MNNNIKTNGDQCSYKCPYYQDGSVLSYCKMFGEPILYDDQISPSRVKKCIDTQKYGLI